MKEKQTKLKNWWGEMTRKHPVILKGVGTVCLWLFAIVFFILNKASYYGVTGDGTPSLLKKKVVIYFACVLFCSLCVVIKNPLKETGNKILNLHIMEWYPVICFVMVETALGANIFAMKTRFFLLNVVMYMFVMYLIYAITASVRASMIGVSIFSALFAITNIYLMEFRNIPLLATDFSDLKAAANVANEFQFQLKADVIILIWFVITSIAVAMKLPKSQKNVKKRIAAGAVFICFFAVMFNMTVLTNGLKKMGVNINTFRPSKSYLSNGGMLTFARSIRYLIIDKPEGYSDKAAAEIAKDYKSDKVSDDGIRPNVIVIMDEAFSDLQNVGNFETNQEVLPFYNSLKEDTVKGYAYVSSFGGKTANSEFEFLTGDTKAFLPDGSTPYQLYIKDYIPSLTGNLKIDNYAGMVAMHPFNASGYNRENVYNSLGFSDFISIEDINMKDVKIIRNLISDESHFSRIVEEYEKANKSSKEPFYMFNVTMQNHSPYNIHYDNLPMDIQITTDSCKDASAERYLNLAHLSDQSAKQLVEYFKNVDEPTVIVFFGDHEPGLSDSFYQKIMGVHPDALAGEQAMQRFKVPFFIWANYDIEEKYLEKTSLNYLQSIMTDVTGMKKTGYNKYLLSLMKDIPAMNAAGYYTADGTFYSINDSNSPYFDKLQEYNMLEYNHLFGKKKVENFYEISK